MGLGLGQTGTKKAGRTAAVQNLEQSDPNAFNSMRDSKLSFLLYCLGPKVCRENAWGTQLRSYTLSSTSIPPSPPTGFPCGKWSPGIALCRSCGQCPSLSPCHTPEVTYRFTYIQIVLLPGQWATLNQGRTGSGKSTI